MRKKWMWIPILSLIGASFIFNGFSTRLFAGSDDKSVGIGVDAGYVMVKEDQFGGGMGAGLNLFYSLSQSIRFELKGGFISSQVENDPQGLSEGKLTMIPIQLSLQFRFKIGNRFFPYLGGGVGYYLNNFTLEGENIWQDLGFEVSNEVDNSFGFHFGLGMDYFFNPRIAFTLDVRYCIVPLSGSYSITDTVSSITNSGDIDGSLDHINFSAGLRFLF
jgi:outer membrane protein W